VAIRREERVSDQGNGPEDFLLERLNEAASGDAAIRALRRRYDMLRNDYEGLLDRLGELEERLVDSPPPTTAFEQAPAGVSTSIAEAITAPLLRLRDEYLAAAGSIQTVVGGLEGLAAGFKGQHRSAPVPPPPVAPDAADPARDIEPRTRKTQIEVKGSGFGELLDFQERLSQVPGVSRVSISAIDNERATLVVELEHRGG